MALANTFSLEIEGLRNTTAVHRNLALPLLYEEAVRRGEGLLAPGGALSVSTGEHTGRTPKDKFTVEEAANKANIWWGSVNQPFSEDKFDSLYRQMLAYMQGRDIFVQDCFAAADPAHRIGVRVITQTAWHSLFARNMFLRPTPEQLVDFKPDFTIIQMPGFVATPKLDGTRTGVFILVNFARRLVLIGGTWYAGEIKKSVFGLLNYLLPAKGVMPMHCSANIGPKGDTAIFFGLSGTGKTTLSADGSRTLIGDDEHGWSDKGVFNFEGGCYAKVIRLSPEAEPEIYAASMRFGTVLENVVVDPVTRALDLDSEELTENTRSCYPLDYIPNVSATGMGGHPENLIMLTADAFGVLPPISQMTPDQAMYHFLSGYTARLAGTERGVVEPEATFSTCFGAPFLPRHPTVYAKLLGEKIAKHKTKCWLVNTGWTGGVYGVGHRMKIAHTRAMVRAALDGQLAQVPTTPDPNFGVLVPQNCPDVPADVLNPKNTWKDKKAYDDTARQVAGMFEKNFKQFESEVDDKVKKAAIRAAA